ncbi:hypothetical protein D7S86_16890 [Pararobbsia silviterrae]|uniref:Uncharacterized protein n=1 Tax=Pararobbsia silviterrae TaxID=1792498 RepID=A0A494XRX9_9BURK|nr:hypothetical protein D7S86_16890 [Pararobbsia silviterrae]
MKFREFIMSDLAQLGSFSSLDDLGPTEPTWHPYAFRTAPRVGVRTQPYAEPQQNTDTRVFESA